MLTDLAVARRSEQEADAVSEPDPTRCAGCGGWITRHRLDTQGCTTCRILAWMR